MEVFISFGEQLIVFLQSQAAWLVPIMQIFTFLGNEEFFLLLMPAFYWCINPGLAIRLGIALMISTAINLILKVGFHSPRPYWVDTKFIAFTTESTFGLPSNHAQNAAVIWGMLAAFKGSIWVWVVCLLLIALIGISRVVLGVHYPIDILIGWSIGALVLYIFINVYEPVKKRFRQWDVSVWVLLFLGASISVLLIGSVMTLVVSQVWELPPEWAHRATSSVQNEPIEPLSLDGLITATAAFFGLCTGIVLLNQAGGFNVAGSTSQKFIRFMIGVIGVLAIWRGLGFIFPSDPSLIAFGLRYFRYALIGIWITWLAPMIFFRLKLAEPGQIVG